MKSVISIFVVLTALNIAQAQTDFNKQDPATNLKNMFDHASDPVLIDDIKEVTSCVMFAGDFKKVDLVIQTLNPPVDRGPYFPQSPKKFPKLNSDDIYGNFYDLITYTETDTELAVKLNYPAAQEYNFTLRLRKSGKELNFEYTKGVTVYGYCWKK